MSLERSPKVKLEFNFHTRRRAKNSGKRQKDRGTKGGRISSFSKSETGKKGEGGNEQGKSEKERSKLLRAGRIGHARALRRVHDK